MSWATTASPKGQVRPPLTADNFLPHKFRSVTGTQHISKGASVSPLPVASQQIDLASIALQPTPAGSTNFVDFLKAMDTDGFLVMHQGQVVAEEYPHGMNPNSSHALASITRSFVASVTAILVEQQQLDLDRAVDTYMPELAETGFAGATVQQLLDMRSGVTSSMMSISQAMFFKADPSDPQPPPQGTHQHLLTLSKDSDHGGKFKYRAGDTEVLGCICEKVTQKSMSELVTELIWQPMGAEKEAELITDVKGTPMFSGGFCCTLRDVARFGLMWLNEGSVNEQQILPVGFVHDTRHGTQDVMQAFSGNFFGLLDSPGKMYKNQTWNLDEKRGTTLMYGANGQMIYIDPPAQLLCVVVSNWPGAFLPDRVQAWFHALAAIRSKVAPDMFQSAV